MKNLPQLAVSIGLLISPPGALALADHARTDRESLCSVTRSNGAIPLGHLPDSNFHGNGALWTQLYPGGDLIVGPRTAGSISRDGSIQIKWPWWQRMPGQLKIVGHRLDASAAPMRAEIGTSAGHPEFNPTSLIFPSPGCWKITATVGRDSLTVITRVSVTAPPS